MQYIMQKKKKVRELEQKELRHAWVKPVSNAGTLSVVLSMVVHCLYFADELTLLPSIH